MISISEIKLYSNLANRIFNYMNGKINIINYPCILNIQCKDCVNNNLGTIQFPNLITIYLEEISDIYTENISKYIDRESLISSMIAWTISHELHHAEQLINLCKYRNDIDYRNKIEEDVQIASYLWVKNHKDEISQLFNFNCIIDNLSAENLVQTNKDYKQAELKDFYIQGILYLLMKLDNSEEYLNIINSNDNIFIHFYNQNNTDSVCIKKNGKYIRENLNKFNILVYNNATKFHNYKYNIRFYNVIDSNGIYKLCISFTVFNTMINLMDFKE